VKRHVVLIGLPGAGKTTVGRLVGAELGAACADPDAEIERLTGLTVPALFAARGEAGFRALECEVMADLLRGVPQVITPGGGWAAQAGALDEAAGRALVVHLRVTPAVALARLGPAPDRPLLAGDPMRRLAELETARAPYHARAEAAVDTDGRSPAQVARDVVALARSRAGW